MAHKTVFSFNYEDDVWRATNVRNCGALSKDEIHFIDASLWEEAKSQSEAAIEKLIDDALAKSTVTAVLIGAQTASREWVQYEIEESIRLGKGLFGVHIYRIKDKDGNEAMKGKNPGLHVEQGQGCREPGRMVGCSIRCGLQIALLVDRRTR